MRSVNEDRLACQCPYGNMHVMENNVCIEIANKGNSFEQGYGDIIVSGLHNHAMPIIRYNTGDIGRILHNEQCPCGCSFPILQLLDTRKDYHICTPSGNFSSAEITFAIERTNEHLNDCILQYQAIQISLDTIELYIVLKENYVAWKNAVSKCFLNSLDAYELKTINWVFYFEKMLLLDNKTGKLAYFKRNFQNGELI